MKRKRSAPPAGTSTAGRPACTYLCRCAACSDHMPPGLGVTRIIGQENKESHPGGLTPVLGSDGSVVCSPADLPAPRVRAREGGSDAAHAELPERSRPARRVRGRRGIRPPPALLGHRQRLGSCSYPCWALASSGVLHARMTSCLAMTMQEMLFIPPMMDGITRWK